jgi:hypothetical protein
MLDEFKSLTLLFLFEYITILELGEVGKFFLSII